MLDIEMPEKNGLATILELHERFENELNPGQGKIPIIVITGLGGETVGRMVKDLGIYAFLQKPFSVASLVSHLEKAVSTASNHI